MQDLNQAAQRQHHHGRSQEDSEEEKDLLKLGIKVIERSVQHLDDSVGKERLPRTYKALRVLALKFAGKEVNS